jgi:hypothetical protein
VYYALTQVIGIFDKEFSKPYDQPKSDSGEWHSDNWASIYKPIEYYVTRGPGNFVEDTLQYHVVYGRTISDQAWLPIASPNDPVNVYPKPEN